MCLVHPSHVGFAFSRVYVLLRRVWLRSIAFTLRSIAFDRFRFAFFVVSSHFPAFILRLFEFNRVEIAFSRFYSMGILALNLFKNDLCF